MARLSVLLDHSPTPPPAPPTPHTNMQTNILSLLHFFPYLFPPLPFPSLLCLFFLLNINSLSWTSVETCLIIPPCLFLFIFLRWRFIYIVYSVRSECDHSILINVRMVNKSFTAVTTEVSLKYRFCGGSCKNDFNSRCCRLSETQCETLLTVSELETLDVVQAVCLRSSETVICLRHQRMTFFQQHPKKLYIAYTILDRDRCETDGYCWGKSLRQSFESNFCLVLLKILQIFFKIVI